MLPPAKSQSWWALGLPGYNLLRGTHTLTGGGIGLLCAASRLWHVSARTAPGTVWGAGELAGSIKHQLPWCDGHSSPVWGALSVLPLCPKLPELLHLPSFPASKGWASVAGAQPPACLPRGHTPGTRGGTLPQNVGVCGHLAFQRLGMALEKVSRKEKSCSQSGLLRQHLPTKIQNCFSVWFPLPWQKDGYSCDMFPVQPDLVVVFLSDYPHKLRLVQCWLPGFSLTPCEFIGMSYSWVLGWGLSLFACFRFDLLCFVNPLSSSISFHQPLKTGDLKIYWTSDCYVFCLQIFPTCVESCRITGSGCWTSWHAAFYPYACELSEQEDKSILINGPPESKWFVHSVQCSKEPCRLFLPLIYHTI